MGAESVPRRAYVDGVDVGSQRHVISLDDRAFLYGDGVFEVWRVYRGRPFRQRQHLQRLYASAAAVRMRVPWPLELLEEELEGVYRSLGPVDAYVRLMFTRGEGPLSRPLDALTNPRRVLLVEPLPPVPRRIYEEGVSAVGVVGFRAVDGVAGATALASPVATAQASTAQVFGAAATKYMHYLGNILAMDEARRLGADEAILLNGQGHVLEAATANVFVVFGATLRTPPLGPGILPGITRSEILHLATREGLDTEEVPLDAEDLLQAQEMFLTSSIREVVPVVRFAGQTLGVGAPGPWTRRLHRALRALAVGEPERMPWEDEPVSP
jgi:branched-chain amino acid aminotransferase